MDKGRVVQAIGTVIDVEFEGTQPPHIHRVLRVDSGGDSIILEVQQHLG
ncbi:MAG: F0F1 ATP synthase subunit beta, partial [Chloroflexota bacterium]